MKLLGLLCVLVVLSAAQAADESCDTHADCPLGEQCNHNTCKKVFCFNGFYMTETRCTNSKECGEGGRCTYGLCCEKLSDTCDLGYHNPKLVCGHHRRCPPGNTCIKGRCCEKAGCKRGFYLSKVTCSKEQPCSNGKDCAGGLCCLKNGRKCPTNFRRLLSTCGYNIKCGKGELCRKGGCCKFAPCQDGQYLSTTRCETGSTCPNTGECLLGRCCKESIRICPRGFRPLPKTCSATRPCPGRWVCNGGRCCDEAKCKSGYSMSTRECSDVTHCPKGQECEHGFCCVKD